MREKTSLPCCPIPVLGGNGAVTLGPVSPAWLAVSQAGGFLLVNIYDLPIPILQIEADGGSFDFFPTQQPGC